MGDTIHDAKNKNEQHLMTFPNVIGVGIGSKEGRQVIKVLVRRKVAEHELDPDHIIPREVEGFSTDVEEIGNVSTQRSFRGTGWIYSLAFVVLLKGGQL